MSITEIRHGERSGQVAPPCRHGCRHYDCLMDRGEPLPAGVVGHQDGVRYHDAQTRARARGEAVRIVDGRHGCSLEHAADPAAHRLDYDEEEARILAAWVAADEQAAPVTPVGAGQGNRGSRA